tara:strand:- start:124 stop:585 length:462 start_codon:yes stop_codon:yes gene_type:complete
MNKTIARCTFISSIAVWIILSLSAPWVLSDENGFLKGFVNHEFLNFLGVVVTITLASTANLHLELNKFEERVKKRIFVNTRNSVKRSAYWMISMLLIALLLVVSKPLIVSVTPSLIASSLLNGGALLIILFNVLILIDLCQTAFKLEPNFDNT